MSDQDLYQQVWDEDILNGNGIKPVLKAEDGKEEEGYIVVDDKETTDQNHQIFPEVHIPKDKKVSYDLVAKLFNNYTLNPRSGEDNILSEGEEVEEFLNFAINSAPMKLVRRIIEERGRIKFSDSKWFTYLYTVWFRQYPSDRGRGRDLSGFEHLFIGESKGTKLSGHHFWYTYYLADQASSDTIYLGPDYKNCENPESPAVVTISYKMAAMDFVKEKYVQLYKEIGGFFVGLSAEGLMAIGTLRFTHQAFAPKDAYINNNHYRLELYRSEGGGGESLRTFFPVYLCR
ncbi:hypothetical protein [Bacillus inaquosorum]|uniref:hypothetical protein n=1 Tax=Bacillus inaquosorum TaxID=483913 RepID=UPI002E04D933|nr:hypothetical protein [Bacillus inaquosorum]MED1194943.1 hypothetical protein [Bacillus inaquosorum]MED1224441.1 hypothetical protein [Bacillus inaquosorum]